MSTDAVLEARLFGGFGPGIGTTPAPSAASRAGLGCGSRQAQALHVTLFWEEYIAFGPMERALRWKRPCVHLA